MSAQGYIIPAESIPGVILGRDGNAYLYYGDDGLSGFFSKIGSFFKKAGKVFVVVAGTLVGAGAGGGTPVVQTVTPEQQAALLAQQQQLLLQQQQAGFNLQGGPNGLGFQLNTTTLLIGGIVLLLLTRR